MIQVTTATLGDIGKVCMCKRIMKEQTSPVGDIPFYKISTFGGRADCYISREVYEDYKTRFSFPKKGAILISAAGTIGRTVVYDGEDAFFQDSNIVWIENDESKVLNEYLYYFYMTNPWVKTFGSTIPRLYNDNIRSISITYPTNIEDQRNAVRIMKTIDSKIANNNAICLNLEAMAKLLYEYWFVQFDFPDENGKPYKSSGGKMVWSEELKREIPAGWDVKRIGDIISTERGISYSTPNIITGEGIPMLNLATFMPGGGDYKADGLKHYLGDYPKNKALKPFELIMCNTQQTAIKFETDIIGRAMLVPDIFDGDVVFSHHVNVIRTDNEYLKYYLLYLFNSDYFHKYISGHTNGTNILGLSFNGVEDYHTEIPSGDLLEAFGKRILEIEKKKSEIFLENEQLASLRDFLLPMLMNGQVKINTTKE